MVVSCCNHVSHVRSSASSSLTLSRVTLFWWVLVPHTVTPFLLYHATPFSLHKFTKHLFPLLALLSLWVWCFLCTPAKTHSTTVVEAHGRCVFAGAEEARATLLVQNQDYHSVPWARNPPRRSQVVGCSDSGPQEARPCLARSRPRRLISPVAYVRQP